MIDPAGPRNPGGASRQSPGPAVPGPDSAATNNVMNDSFLTPDATKESFMTPQRPLTQPTRPPAAGSAKTDCDFAGTLRNPGGPAGQDHDADAEPDEIAGSPLR
jgi:hypothetical protein